MLWIWRRGKNSGRLINDILSKISDVMCFSLEASLSSWAFSLIFVVLLMKRNKGFDNWNASFLLCFSTIQLVEAGLWWNYGSQTNDSMTRCILPLLMLQPLVQCYSGWKATNSKVLENLTYVYSGLFVFSLGYLSRKSQTKIGEHGHFVWEAEEGNFIPGWISPFYLFGLFFPLLWQREKGIPLIAIGAGTALYSWFKTKGQEFSSYWCFTSTIYGLIAYLE